MFTSICALLAARPSLAGPQGGVVVSGQANVSTQGNTTNVNQSTLQAIINWQSFSIAPYETVNFNQPSPLAVTLNRVIGNEQSVIAGALNAPGQVFIVNTAGIVFTKSAQVNVGGIVASTLDISNSNFKAGAYQFSGSSTTAVVNQGSIRANPGGYVALLGNTVSNQGTITATLGTVTLASGSKVTLNFGGNSLLDVTTDQGTLNALVENKGMIKADGGRVVLTARAADALLSAQVNNTGVVQARTMSALMGGGAPRTGSIKLLATGGRVNVGGRLDASAPRSGNGGTIETSGAKVSVASNAVVTTKSSNGKDGSWLIDPDGFTIAAAGGDITGAALSNELANGNVIIQSTSGSGKTPIYGDIDVNDAVSWAANTSLTLLANNFDNVNAPITATGASAGLVLTPFYGVTINAPINMPGASSSLTLSSYADVAVNAALNVASISGTIGNNLNFQQPQVWTTPPDLSKLTVTDGVNVNAPLSWSTGTLALTASNVNINAPVNWSAGAALDLTATFGSVNVSAPLTGTGAGLLVNAGAGFNVAAANALNVASIGGIIGTDFNFQKSQSWTTPPDLTGLSVGNNFNVNAPLSWSTGTLTLPATNNINIAAPLIASGAGAGLTLNAGADLNVGVADVLSVATVNGTIGHDFNIQQSQTWATPPDFTGLSVANNVNINAPLTWSGALTFAANANINVNASLSWSSGTLTLTAGQNVDVNAAMTATGTANFVANYGYVLDGNNNPTTTPTAGVNADGAPYGLYSSFAPTGGYSSQIDFSGSGSVTLNGQNYRVLATEAQLLATANNPSGNYVLGNDIAISSLTEIPSYTGNFNGFGHSLPVASVSGLSFATPLSIGSLKNTNVVLNSVGDISINAPVNSGAGALTFNAGGAINLNASLQNPSGSFGSFVFSGKGLNVGTTASVSGQNIVLNAPTNWSSNAALTLSATNNIYINASITATGANAGLVLNSGGDYIFNNASTSITLSGANPSLTINGNSYEVINSLAQLEALSPLNGTVNANGYYALGSDIDAGGVTFSGPVINDLEGTLAGFNHVIKNLTINDATLSNNDGLIGQIGTVTGLAATVRDIGLVNANVVGYQLDPVNGANGTFAGGLVANNYGTINNAYVNGGSVSGYEAGGLAGGNFGNINNSWANVAVVGIFGAGGLVGVNSQNPNNSLIGGNINNSYANGPVSAVGVTNSTGGLQGADFVGGLAGINYGVISNSHATGTVSALDVGEAVGGLVGANWNLFGSPQNGGTITNSYATGNVNVTVTNQYSATQGVGGLVGYNWGGYVSGSQASGNVTVAVTSTNAYAQDVGGLVGLNQSSLFGTGGVIDRSSASGAVTGVGYVFTVGGLVGSNADPFTTVTNSTATGYVSGNYDTGGLFGAADPSASYGGNSYSISGTGQTSAAGFPPNDATVGAVGTNPPPAPGPSTGPSLSTQTQPLLDASQTANVISTVDTSLAANSPPRPRAIAAAGTARTSALSDPSLGEQATTPSRLTEAEWLKRKRQIDAANERSRAQARARSASLGTSNHGRSETEAEAPPRPHLVPAPKPLAKPKGAGFGAKIRSIEIEGKKYDLQDKPGAKPPAPDSHQ